MELSTMLVTGSVYCNDCALELIAILVTDSK